MYESTARKNVIYIQYIVNKCKTGLGLGLNPLINIVLLRSFLTCHHIKELC